MLIDSVVHQVVVRRREREPTKGGKWHTYWLNTDKKRCNVATEPIHRKHVDATEVGSVLNVLV